MNASGDAASNELTKGKDMAVDVASSNTETPTMRMLDMLDGLRLTNLLCVLAELGVADQLADGPRTVEDIADRTGTHAPSLYRVIRAVASKGVFTETAPRTFALTPTAEILRSGVPGSLRDSFVLHAQPAIREAYGDLGHTVRTGEPAFEHVHGADLFTFLTARPELSQLFSNAMGNQARVVQRAAVAEYDLSGVRRLVDVGGAHGHLVAALLGKYPEMHGVVFDLPKVVPGAERVLTEAGVADRAEFVGGDYLRAVPERGDAYVISHVSHQLSDEDAITVFSNVRKAMDPNGQVVVIDPVLPEGDTPHPGKFMDITMMTLTHGRDRTEAELADLFRAAGLRHVDTVALSAPSSVVVAVPA